MANNLDQEYSIPIKNFLASKQKSFFKSFRESQFSGKLVLVSETGTTWYFYLYLGRVIYATGGEHSVRRWRRNLTAHVPEIATAQEYLGKQLKSTTADTVKWCWEYELLRRWLIEQKTSRKNVVKMVTAILAEIFFDLNQVGELYFYLDSQIAIPITEQIFLVDTEQIIDAASQQWQDWVSAGLGDRSPNRAPVIKFAQELQAKVSPKIYSILQKLLNGRNTLRDLSIPLKKDLIELSHLILPYIQLGYIDLVPLADLPAPVSISTGESTEKPPLIACVDDSSLVCQTMAAILEQRGYRFLGIDEPTMAIAKILAAKPDLIFLDLVMPEKDGYEICGSLRKLLPFRRTPIVMLAPNDGFIERTRSKMVGASDFMIKPIQDGELLKIIAQYL